ncbi:MAG: hypothetical protein GX876_06140 [Bacteroidales bacterium]|nr:hypothetical protein [Bacteroidales bacterium]
MAPAALSRIGTGNVISVYLYIQIVNKYTRLPAYITEVHLYLGIKDNEPMKFFVLNFVEKVITLSNKKIPVIHKMGLYGQAPIIYIL